MYLIIGASGFLGSYLVRTVCENTQDKVIAAARRIDCFSDNERVHYIKCDVTSQEDICSLAALVSECEPLKVLYTAAFHNIDLIPQKPDEARNVNIIALSNFLGAVKNISALFFTSTDCVYGEGRRFGRFYRFKESDPALPDCAYGVQKKEAEALVTAFGYNALRMPFMLGKSITPLKKHFYDNIISSLSAGDSIRMLDGFFRSAISYETAARLIIELCELKAGGANIPSVLNVCGDDAYSKYDLGVIAADSLGAPHSLVEKLPESAAEEFYREPRAKTGLMDNSLLKSILSLNEIKLRL